jgi:hypothetical protein
MNPHIAFVRITGNGPICPFLAVSGACVDRGAVRSTTSHRLSAPSVRDGGRAGGTGENRGPADTRYGIIKDSRINDVFGYMSFHSHFPVLRNPD